MLKHEEHVKNDGEESKSKLGWVTKNAAPIIIVVSNEDHLEYTEGSTGEIEDDVPNAPAHSAFAPEVHVSLWHVLDDRDSQLNVGAVVEEVQPRDGADNGEDESDDDHTGDYQEKAETAPGDSLIAPVVDDALEDCDGTSEDRVDREEDIIGLDGDDPTRMAREIVILN